MLFLWDLNNKNSYRQYIEICEFEFRKRFDDFVENIAVTKGLRFLTIAGPSSSGKTTVANRISDELYKQYNIPSKIISLDDFYKNKKEIRLNEKGGYDFETPEAIDIDLLLSCIYDILETNRTKLPKFNFKTGARESEYIDLAISPGEIIIIEGIHGLNPDILDNLPEYSYKSIYITIGERIYLPNGLVISKRDIRFMRRLIRDYKHRGATPEITFEMWETVCAGEEKYIFPYENNADLKINSLHHYEICVIKAQAENLLKTVPSDSSYYPRATELLNKLEIIPVMEEELVPENSLIKEFIS